MISIGKITHFLSSTQIHYLHLIKFDSLKNIFQTATKIYKVEK